MPVKVLNIPTLNDSHRDFEQLFSLLNHANGFFEEVVFNFTKCQFLRPNAVAFIGGFARLIQSRMGTVTFNWNTIEDEAVLANLRQNGFAWVFGYSSGRGVGNSIPYREDRLQDVNSIMDYLTFSWLGRGWVQLTPRLRDAIAGKMWEIYTNAFEHAGSEIGVFSCGQHFPNNNELVLSTVDFGQGIASNVKNYLNQDLRAHQLPADSCLNWAFQRGTSTRPNGMARGLGLDLLKEFVRVNHGKLEVYSNEGYGIIDRNGERYENRPISFDGTIFHITLRCDERLYRFTDESADYLPF